MEQANVLDALPDAIIIADPDEPSYLNEEAVQMLNCKADIKVCQEDLGSLMCVDRETGSEVTLKQQLIKSLAIVDNRLAEISPESFFKTLIDSATDKATLLNLQSKPEEAELSNPEDLEQAR